MTCGRNLIIKICRLEDKYLLLASQAQNSSQRKDGHGWLNNFALPGAGTRYAFDPLSATFPHTYAYRKATTPVVSAWRTGRFTFSYGYMQPSAIHSLILLT